MIPINWFLGASADSDLVHFEVAALNRAANLEKEAKAIKQEAEEQRIEARVAAWLREHRQEILQSVAGKHIERIEEIRQRESAA